MIGITLFLVLFLQYFHWSMSNVCGIDFATDAMKIAIVKPGRPLEIVTNFQSKRKTPTCIAFYKGERLFGSDAFSLMGRKPELTFTKLPRILGKDINNPFVDEFETQFYPYEFHQNRTGHFLQLKVEDSYYSLEELISMILSNVKEITKSFAGQEIKDCVITIPSFFTQHEKQALYTAANIADINVLSLIEENTAAALNYGMDRVMEAPTNVLFYNMGAGSTQVSIVSYSSYQAKEAGKNKTVGQFEVVGKAWDNTLGGNNFDLKIAEHLADKFNTLWHKKPSGKDKDVRHFVRAMTRLRLESVKMKEVLSANQEFPYRLEQLHADLDLVGKITRNEFENEICSDLFARILNPIEQALLSANLTIKDISSVELLGGSVRIPKVKKILDDYFKGAHDIEVGQHLNGDEAMALGAAFKAANLSTQFRVRKVGMSDYSPFDISVRVQTLPASEEQPTGFFSRLFSSSKPAEPEQLKEGEAAEEQWQKHTVLFPSKTTFPTKNKLIAFSYDKDILCTIEYEKEQPVSTLPPGTDSLIAVYNITGVTAFAQKYKDTGVAPKVQLGFNIDNSGRAQLVKAEAIIELPSTETEEASSTNSTAAESADSAETNSTADTATGEAPAAKVAPAPKKKVIRQQLTINEDNDVVVPPRWSNSHVAEAKTRIRALQIADDLRKAKAAALNELESYIYRVKNRIMDDETKLKAISTDEQRQEVLDLASAAEEWLYDEGADQPVSVYKSKQSELQTKFEAIIGRFDEMTARPEAIKKVKSALDDVKRAVNSWAEKLPHITDDEKADILKQVEKIDAWIEEKAEAQEKITAFEKPIFHSSEVTAQLKPLRVMYDKLLKKPKPAPAVEKKENTTSSENATNVEQTPETTAPPTGHEEDVVKVKMDQDQEDEAKEGSQQEEVQKETTGDSSSQADNKEDEDEL